jgi:hypothetical protein
MPFRIDDYSETTSSPAGRDFATLNLLICLPCEMRSLFLWGSKLENRSTWVWFKFCANDEWNLVLLKLILVPFSLISIWRYFKSSPEHNTI